METSSDPQQDVSGLASADDGAHRWPSLGPGMTLPAWLEASAAIKQEPTLSADEQVAQELQRGYEEGYQAGRQAAQAELEALEQRWQTLLAQGARVHDQLRETLLADFAEAQTAVLSELFLTTITIQPELLKTLTDLMCERITSAAEDGQRPMTLAMSAADHALFARADATELPFNLRADNAVTNGTIRLESGASAVRLDFADSLRAIVEAAVAGHDDASGDALGAGSGDVMSDAEQSSETPPDDGADAELR